MVPNLGTINFNAENTVHENDGSAKMSRNRHN